MATFNSLLYKPRVTRVFKNKIKLLNGAPMKLGIVTKAVLRSPKKPHSAKRATVKFHLIGKRFKKNYCFIGGVGGRDTCNRPYDKLMFRGGRRRDIPALKYCAVFGYKRGTVGPRAPALCQNARSKYGASLSK